MKTDPRYPTVIADITFCNRRVYMSAAAPCGPGCSSRPPVGAQQIIQLPAEDRWLEADFEELYRLGSMAGEDWEQFGVLTCECGVRRCKGNLFVFDRLMPNSDRVRGGFGRPT